MDNYSYNQQDLLQVPVPSVAKNFMANVFLWMFAALTITAGFAYLFANNLSLMSYILSSTFLTYAVMWAPLVCVLSISFLQNKLSFGFLAVLFIVYSIINGISFSFLSMIYTSSSITICFVTAALMFGLMAILGYTTKTDLTKLGTLLMIGAFGIFIMSIINYFMQSDKMGYILGGLGVIVFTGLTAYDIQKLKNVGNGIDAQGNAIEITGTKKLAVLGALSLYLDFVNLFISLLRLVGRRN